MSTSVSPHSPGNLPYLSSYAEKDVEPVSFSVVINTDNRLEYLKRTLEGLKFQTYLKYLRLLIIMAFPLCWMQLLQRQRFVDHLITGLTLLCTL